MNAMREGARSVVGSRLGSFREPFRALVGSHLQVIFRAEFGTAFAEAGQWPRRPEAPGTLKHPPRI